MEAAEVPRAVTLTIVSEPAGSQIKVNGTAIERLTPATIDGHAPGSVLEIELTQSGYKPWVQPVSVGQEPTEVSAVLEPLPRKKTKPDVKKISPKPRAKKKALSQQRAERTSQKTFASKKAPGRLFLRSSGLWFHVYLNGKKLGTTPLAGVSIPAGRHTLRLLNDVAGVEQSVDVTIEPGQTLRRTVQAKGD